MGLMTLGVDWVLLLVLPELTSTAAESSKMALLKCPKPYWDATVVGVAGSPLDVVSHPWIPQRG